MFEVIADTDEDETTKVVNRLSDVETREISLVDRPAIKRTFLVVKRDENETQQEQDMSGTATKTPKTPKTEEPKVTEDTTKSLVAARVDEALTRVQTLKGVLANATSGQDANALPEAVSNEMRAIQFMLKGMAGITKGIALMVPGTQDLEDCGEVGSKIKKSATKILTEVETRLTTLKVDLGESEMLDAAQAKKLDAAADLIAKVQISGATLVVLKSSVTDAQRAVLVLAIEKAMNGLGNLYVGLHTEAVVDTTKIADQIYVGGALHESASVVEKAVAEILQNVEKRDPMILLIEDVRAIQKWDQASIEAAPEEERVALAKLKAENGEFVVKLTKAASQFRSRVHWDLPDGDPKKYSVIKEFAPEPTVQVAFFGSRMEADNDALRRNIEAVTTVAKAAAGGTTGTAAEDFGKKGAAMKATRLTRLKGAIDTLKEALADLQSGTQSMEKFKSSATELDVLAGELSKAATVQRGLTDANDGDPGSPNMGAGQQDDSSAVAGTDGIAGAGTDPGLTDVIKRLNVLEGEKVTLAKRLEDQEKVSTQLKKDNKVLRKRRAAPSTVPADSKPPKKVKKSDEEESFYWPQDMNDLS